MPNAADSEGSSLDRFLHEAGELTATGADDVGESSRREQHLERIATAFELAARDIGWSEAGREAGSDSGRWFFTLSWQGLDLAFRDDLMRLYLEELPRRMSTSAIQSQLAERGVRNVRIPSGRRLKEMDRRQRSRWIMVATGKPPRPGRPGRPTYLVPGSDRELPAEALALASIELEALLESEKLEPSAAAQSSARAARPGDLLARVEFGSPGEPGLDLFAGKIEAPGGAIGLPQAGDGVELREDGFYATHYGYLCLMENRLSLRLPLRTDSEFIHAWWLVLGRPQPVTETLVRDGLAELEVGYGVDGEAIARLQQRLEAGECPPGAHLIACGRRAEDGRDARVEIALPVGRQAGRELPDGSIDFREVNYAVSVREGEEVALFIPATAGTPGVDLRGQALPAAEGREGELVAGENVRVEDGDEGAQVFVAETEGALTVAGDEISVLEILTVEGNVDYATGNLQFSGEVFVKGSVVQGFAVRAGGSITVSETVEAAASLSSRRDIVVGKGVVGKRTRLVANGSIRAQFVQDASLQAGEDIELGNFAYHAFLRAGGHIRVAKGTGERGGSIVGGQAWAQRGFEIHQAGAPVGTRTILGAGILPDQVRKMEELEERVEQGQQLLRELLSRFGLTAVDMGRVRRALTAASGPRRAELAMAANQLGEVAQARSKLVERLKALREQARVASAHAEIAIAARAFPGTTLRLGDFHRTLGDQVEAPRYHLLQGELMER